MPDELKSTAAVPREWLAQAVSLINAMAGDGVYVEGQANPEELMDEIAAYLDLGETDDPWDSAVLKVRNG